MQKNVILGLVFLTFCSVIVYKLRSNKQEIGQLASLSTQKHAFLPVTVTTPSGSNLAADFTADGIFMPNKEMWVLSETQGHIVDVYKAKGDAVHIGDAIAQVDSEMLQIELETIKLNIDKLEKDRSRLAHLIDADAVAKNKIEEVELGIATARAKMKGVQKQLQNTTIKAPINGIITYRVVEKDGVIGLGIQVAQITDISRVLLTVRVPELDVHKVKKGQLVLVTPDALATQQFKGKVRNIGIKADQAFTYDIEIEVENTQNLAIKAGMHGRATFQTGGTENGLFIPIDALVGSVHDAQVYVVEQDSTVRLRRIVVEKLDQKALKITSGLSLTDRVVTSGSLTLTDGEKVVTVAH